MAAGYRNAEAERVDYALYLLHCRSYIPRSYKDLAEQFNVTPQRIAYRIKRYRIRHKLER